LDKELDLFMGDGSKATEAAASAAVVGAAPAQQEADVEMA